MLAKNIINLRCERLCQVRNTIQTHKEKYLTIKTSKGGNNIYEFLKASVKPGKHICSLYT